VFVFKGAGGVEMCHWRLLAVRRFRYGRKSRRSLVEASEAAGVRAPLVEGRGGTEPLSTPPLLRPASSGPVASCGAGSAPRPRPLSLLGPGKPVRWNPALKPGIWATEDLHLVYREGVPQLRSARLQ
jgi:hypothetical protein